MGFMHDKKVLIAGVASNRSIAWGIAKAMQREGAEIALTYLGERFKDRVKKLADELGISIIVPCDVRDDKNIENTFTELKKHWNEVDVIVHSIAFANKEELAGFLYEKTTREGFLTAHEISSYSFIAMAREAKNMLGKNASLLTMSYLGAVRAIPHYNAMGLAKASLEAGVRYLAADLGPNGVRVNGISAGPIKTLAAKGIDDFNLLLDYAEKNSPLRRNITIEEVGNAAAFLSSDLASGINGEIMYVDGGYNITGMGIHGVKGTS